MGVAAGFGRQEADNAGRKERIQLFNETAHGGKEGNMYRRCKGLNGKRQ